MTSLDSHSTNLSANASADSNGACPHCHQPMKKSATSTGDFRTTLDKLFPNAYGLEEFV
ncbi:unnamed protein product, partial [Adineta steineri]